VEIVLQQLWKARGCSCPWLRVDATPAPSACQKMKPTARCVRPAVPISSKPRSRLRSRSTAAFVFHPASPPAGRPSFGITMNLWRHRSRRSFGPCVQRRRMFHRGRCRTTVKRFLPFHISKLSPFHKIFKYSTARKPKVLRRQSDTSEESYPTCPGR